MLITSDRVVLKLYIKIPYGINIGVRISFVLGTALGFL